MRLPHEHHLLVVLIPLFCFCRPSCLTCACSFQEALTTCANNGKHSSGWRVIRKERMNYAWLAYRVIYPMTDIAGFTCLMTEQSITL